MDAIGTCTIIAKKDKRKNAMLNRKHQILSPVMKILVIESTPDKKW